MTTNKAAERLREAIREAVSDFEPEVASAKAYAVNRAADEALAAERRATVERIRSAVDWNVPAHAELEAQLAAALHTELGR